MGTSHNSVQDALTAAFEAPSGPTTDNRKRDALVRTLVYCSTAAASTLTEADKMIWKGYHEIGEVGAVIVETTEAGKLAYRLKVVRVFQHHHSHHLTCLWPSRHQTHDCIRYAIGSRRHHVIVCSHECSVIGKGHLPVQSLYTVYKQHRRHSCGEIPFQNSTGHRLPAIDSSDCVQDTACCLQCGKVVSGALSMQSCSQCMRVRFCSTECQRAAWPAHKAACKRMARATAAGACIEDQLLMFPDVLQACPSSHCAFHPKAVPEVPAAEP